MEEDQKDQEQQVPDPQDEQQEQQPEQGKEPGPVPYARFSEVNKKLRAAEAKLKKLEDERRAAEEAKLKEQGDYKSLLEQREIELKALRLQSERLRVATAKGLPIELAERLQGETAKELEADADKLLTLFKNNLSTLGVPPPTHGDPAAPVDFTKMTPAEIREWSEKHGWGRR